METVIWLIGLGLPVAVIIFFFGWSIGFDNGWKACKKYMTEGDGGIKMPIYRAGECYTCSEESEYLLPEIGFNEDSPHFFMALLCPKCRDAFRKMREENGDFDEKID